MCGIAGFVSASEAYTPAAIHAVESMTDQMKTRGPDGAGLWARNTAVLGHRRLAILDLDTRASQPMLSADGRYAIVFNGEIYNFRELKRELESQGMRFRTTSDTEVVLALYARDGERMLPRLRGMFAMAIWEIETRELFVARDPYGIKPLYHAQTKDGWLFASQVKALLASGMLSTQREQAAVAGFYLWGSVPEPWTLCKDVFALPSGAWMRVRHGACEEPVMWYDICDSWCDANDCHSPDELEQRVREAVTDSVQAHLVSDVPVSVFLSGGVDSGTIAGLASELGANVEGITVGFDEFTTQHADEVPVAAATAQHYGLKHTVRKVTREEFQHDIPRILSAMDQPTIDGVNTWFASKAAAERGYKVVLSGTGGDELFHGYSIARQIPREACAGRWLGGLPGFRLMMRGACDYLVKKGAQPKMRGVPTYMGSIEGAYFLRRSLFLPADLPALMGAEQAREGLDRLGGWPPGMSKVKSATPGSAVCLLDTIHYLRNQLLRDSDWTSMHHSLELRTPLVDAELLDALKLCQADFEHGRGKKLLARSPRRRMPRHIVARRKTGFAVPMTQWLATVCECQKWETIPQLASPGTPWARRWAKVVLDSFDERQ